MSKHIETFKRWSETFHGDVDALKALVESADAHAEARKLGAAALNYLVTRLDLVPDHNEGIGSLDDVMVLRVCANLASSHRLGDLPGDAEVTLARLGNEADRIGDFLGGDLYDKLKAYCSRLAGTAVRGRTPQQIVEEDEARQQLYVDVDAELARAAPVVISDAEDAELRLKSYLTQKLR